MFAVLHFPRFALQAVLRHEPESWGRAVVLVDPSMTTRDRIDNGMMPKAVERPAEIQRLVENREPKNPVW